MKLNKDFLRCNDLGLLVLRLTMGGLMSLPATWWLPSSWYTCRNSLQSTP